MEAGAHSPAQVADQVQGSPAVAGAVPAGEDAPPQHDPIQRAREELMMLYVGFGTGITIAVVFLVYIVMEKLKILP